MAITITINATDAIELREQLHLLLGAAASTDALAAVLHEAYQSGANLPQEHTPTKSELLASAADVLSGKYGNSFAFKAPATAPVQVPTEQPVDNGDNLEIPEQKQEVKKRRAHRKVKAGAPEPSEPSHDDGAPQAESDLNAAGSDLTGTSDADIFAGIDPVFAQKVKDEVLPQLRDLFVSGKVKQVRAILDKFGEGAKSIPEIDAKQFPAIREFMAAGA